METSLNRINISFALRSGRAGRIEFWRDNGDGTCTRLRDGLTLSSERYDALPPKRPTIRPLH